MNSCDACYFRGPPSATWSIGRKICFQPPFETLNIESPYSCIMTSASNSGCYNDNECPVGNRCIAGACTPVSSDFAPRAISSVSYDQLSGFMTATGLASPAAMKATQGAKSVCRGDMVQTIYKGKMNIVCPVNMDPSLAVNCKNCLKSVYQCDHYKAAGDLDGYNQCKQLEDCLQFNVTFPNGNVVAAASKVSPQCLAATSAALKKCGNQCVQCSSPFCDSPPPPV